MLTLRTEQMDAFRAAAREGFRESMVSRLKQCPNSLVGDVPEDQLRKTVIRGMARADRYGFNMRGPVRLYLELMPLLGSHFDTDPQYPWATDILANADSFPQMERAERLYEAALDYLHQVAGPADANLRSAVKNLLFMTSQHVMRSPDAFETNMLRELRQIYPEKVAYVGEERFRRLIREASRDGTKYHFMTVRSAALLVALKMILGHGCVEDPLLPWISEVLHNDSTVDPMIRLAQLEVRTRAHFELALSNDEKTYPP